MGKYPILYDKTCAEFKEHPVPKLQFSLESEDESANNKRNKFSSAILKRKVKRACMLYVAFTCFTRVNIACACICFHVIYTWGSGLYPEILQDGTQNFKHCWFSKFSKHELKHTLKIKLEEIMYCKLSVSLNMSSCLVRCLQ